jgi:hypothetical protein
MCPFCLATVAWVAAGVASTGGVSALVVKKMRGRNQEMTTNYNDQGERHGQEQ